MKKSNKNVKTTSIILAGLLLMTSIGMLNDANAVSPQKTTKISKATPDNFDAYSADVWTYDNQGDEYEGVYEQDSSSSTGYEFYAFYTPFNGSTQLLGQYDVADQCGDSQTHPQSIIISYNGNSQWEIAFEDQYGNISSESISTSGTSINTNDGFYNLGANTALAYGNIAPTGYVIEYYQTTTCFSPSK